MSEDVARRLADGDPSLFVGATAAHALGWLRHVERYLGDWLDAADRRRPRRFERTLLLGMGGSSSAARLYAETRPESPLTVLDTSNPDTVAATEFSEATVIASSKSGGTVETQALLAQALANGLDPVDLVVITDPGTSLAELAVNLGATLVEADLDTGGRFSGLSPFGLLPALYAGWTVAELREELLGSAATTDLAAAALEDTRRAAASLVDGWSYFPLPGDPIGSGGALWLEQLIAETTGKSGRGFVPVVGVPGGLVRPGQMQHWHFVAALLARVLEVDPFDQPDVDGAKRAVFTLLGADARSDEVSADDARLAERLALSSYNVVQAYAPLDSGPALSHLREGLEERYGTTTANLGPRYLHSTGQLHKGGPAGVVAVQVINRPRSAPWRIMGRRYSFHDLHRAQADADLRAMRERHRDVARVVVDDFDEAARLLGLEP